MSMWKKILTTLFPGLVSSGLSQLLGLTRGERQQNQFNAEQSAMQRQFEAQQMEAANVFNAEEAEKNRQFQAEQSATAYQRQVADMKAAGVNPALMYGNGASGASTPSGSAATSAMASGSAASGSGRGVSMSELLGMMKVRKEIDLLDAEIKDKYSDASLKESQKEYTNVQAQMYTPLSEAQLKQFESALQNDEVQRALNRAGISEVEARKDLELSQAMLNSIDAKSREEMNRQAVRLRIAEVSLAYSQSAEARQRVEHLKADIQRIGNEALVLAAQEGKILAESQNLLLEAGILRSTGKEHEFTVKYQNADRVWRNVGTVFGIAGQVVSMGSAAATGVAALRGASNLGKLGSSLAPAASENAFLRQIQINRYLPNLR